jgi:hypothetical protein
MRFRAFGPSTEFGQDALRRIGRPFRRPSQIFDWDKFKRKPFVPPERHSAIVHR